MNVLFIGDYDLGIKSAEKETHNLLDIVRDRYGLKKLITFNEAGTDYKARSWAYDKKIPYCVFDTTKSRYPLNQRNYPDNKWFRKIVDDYSVDAFLFYFLDYKEDISEHKDKIRYLYGRAKKAFKSKILFTNKDI